MTRHKEIKKQAREYYLQWMKERTISKALGKEVHITKKGWNHLLERNIKDQLNRFTLLKAAKHIIKEGSTHIPRQRQKVKYIILEGEFKLNGRLSRIRVVLKEDNKGKYIFYSVMKIS